MFTLQADGVRKQHMERTVQSSRNLRAHDDRTVIQANHRTVFVTVFHKLVSQQVSRSFAAWKIIHKQIVPFYRVWGALSTVGLVTVLQRAIMAVVMDELATFTAYGAGSSLTLSVMTLRGASLAQRVEAAALAGFQGIGWHYEDFTEEQYADGSVAHKASQLFGTSGVKPLEIEFFRDWITNGDNPAYREKKLSSSIWLSR